MVDQTTTPPKTEAMTGREKLALLVISVAGVGIVLVSAIVIIAAWAAPANGGAQNLSMQVFSALVPVFATWVGTILAFYFSRENFKQASDSTREMFREAISEERLRTVPIRSAMIPRAQLTVAKIESPLMEAGLELKSLLDLLKGSVTRLPILDESDSARYVIHESMLYKFIAEHGSAGDAQGEKLTLATFLDHANMRTIVENIAFVSVDGTLADAKSRMEARQKCQDVFVSQNGAADEPVLGYLTNVDISKHSKA
ncbi:MAG: hypothetical protein MI920_16200 [Kiloniellales bacterium]|nr:hypothetical protein [Kiloniellales bacterium]